MRKQIIQQKPSLTKQAPAMQADINNIMEKFRPGQVPPHDPAATRKPMFIDISNVDYQEMLNRVIEVEAKFESIPARIRKRFQSPAHLVAWVDNPQNLKQAQEWGLLPSPEQPTGPSPELAMLTEIRDNLKSDPEANPRKNA